jgi:aminoglycoside phosphotransferase (APT) family kinase protein
MTPFESGVQSMDGADFEAVTGQAEDRLCLVVEQVLRAAPGRPVGVSSVRTRPSPFATLFPADVLTVELEGGSEVSLFRKRLGTEQSDHPDKQRRDREVRVYEALLGDDRLPVVRYYGSRWDEATERREVFLEYVDDWNLKCQGLEHWFLAAHRLAELHAAFAARTEELLAYDFLLRLDAAYLHQWADRAVSVVGDRSARLAAELARVMAGYGPVAEMIARQPPTLVHNDLAPKNVLADRSSDPARICFVDWEMAGVGCGLMDLVVLKYGLDPADDQTMCSVYCEALAGTGLLPPSRQDLERLFVACELQRSVYRLAHSAAWKIPIERVDQWVTEARQFQERV